MIRSHSQEMPSDAGGSISSGSLLDAGLSARTGRSLGECRDSSLIRVSISKASGQEWNIRKLMGLVSKFGEVQSMDMSRYQFDSTFAVSYFDIRAASYARLSIADGSIPNISIANERTRCNSYIEHFEEVPHSCSISGRCVTVSGFPTCDSTYKDVLVSVFSRFGEIDTITHNSTNEFKVAFFDSRTPLAIQAVLHTDRTYSEQVRVSSEELVPLLLAGTSIWEPEPPRAEEGSESGDSGRTPRTASEFAIDICKLESGHETRTTVMIRNIPRSFTQKTVADILTKRFANRIRFQNDNIFDFLYLPMDLVNRVNVGYVFVNFTKSEYVVHCLRFLNGKTWRTISDSVGIDRSDDSEISKVARVTFARLQGKDALMGHFSKSSIMHNQHPSVRPLFL